MKKNKNAAMPITIEIGSNQSSELVSINFSYLESLREAIINKMLKLDKIEL